MSPTADPVEVLDLELSLAAIALGVARSARARCPSAENTRRLQEAEAAVDALLDRRSARGR